MDFPTPVCPMSWQHIQHILASGNDEELRQKIFLCLYSSLYFPSSDISRDKRRELITLIQKIIQEERSKLGERAFDNEVEKAEQQWQQYFKDVIQYNTAHHYVSVIGSAWKKLKSSSPEEFLASCVNFLVAYEDELGKREGGEGPWIQCWIDVIEMLEQRGSLPEAETAVSERTKLLL